MVAETNINAGDPAKSMHLSDLTIRGFCGIRDLSIEHLGQVTLIAGENGVGKTTLLDAVRVFANRGSTESLIDLLERRDELYELRNDTGDAISAVRWVSLFYDRTMDADSVIAIGPKSAQAQLIMRLHGPRIDDIPGVSFTDATNNEKEVWVLRAEHENKSTTTIMSPKNARRSSLGDSIDGSGFDHESHPKCVAIGPGILSNRQTRALWSTVALTQAEDEAVAALNLIVGQHEEIERIAFIGDEPRISARPIVRRAGEEEPVPLRSLGDGAVRTLGLTLALANCRGGFLLIDEVENGIHYSVQEHFWNMILETAHRNSIQVLATTHSWDTVYGYARAAAENEAIDGALIRLERDGDETFVVEYSQRELAVVAEQGIEVR